MGIVSSSGASKMFDNLGITLVGQSGCSHLNYIR